MSTPARARVQRSAGPEIAFYLPEHDALRGQDPLSLDPDRDWRVFGTGVYVWILQTFLRLRAAGAPVRLVDTAPPTGVVVAHAVHCDRLLAETDDPGSLTIVVTRSDRPAQWLADFEVVQNGASVIGPFQFFIPSWLQPGLVPRQAERGARVETVAYVGAIKELDPSIADPSWAETLLARGLRWDCRAIRFNGNDQVYQQLRWHDYSETDLVVALRAPGARDLRSKPAAKLQNAWAAGVPAILSPESPYRELRRSSLDYVEAHDSSEVLGAIERLRSTPALYAAMVRNGFERARAFSPDRLVSRWIDVLWREIPRRAGSPSQRLLRRARRYRAVARRLQSRLPLKPLPADTFVRR